MLGGPGLQIGRILGIPIVVHGSWLLVFAFVTWTLATAYLPIMLPGQTGPRYWGMGAVAAMLLFGSVLLHELGHCWVALRYRIPIGRITLFVFGGVAHMRREAPTPRAEFLIAIAGPIVSVLLGAACLAGVYFGELIPGAGQMEGLLVLAGLLGSVNLQIGLFNLIPGFPLDGGRALRAGLWAWSKDFHTATKRSAVAGLVFGLLLVLAGVTIMLSALFDWLPDALVTNGMWMAMIGLFLFATAKASRTHAGIRERLSLLTIGAIATRTLVTIPGALSLETAVRDYFLPHGFSGFPVVRDDQLVGMVTLRELQRVPSKLWSWREVHQVMRPLDSRMMIGADQSALDALEQMAAGDSERLLVMEGEQVLGIVTRSTIFRYLELRTEGQSEEIVS